MVKISWLGEDTQDTPGPSYNIWNEIRFPKGEAVEVTDPHMIDKARKNQFYKVMEDKEAKHEGEAKIEEQGKVEAQTEVIKKQEDNERKVEKGTGYSPVKKKQKKEKAATLDRPTADP